ncbi:MAG: hypothetical protein RL027_8 [Pseudomonadota bacterium]|jgi:ribonuclease HI
MTINIYTDGSCFGNLKGGWAYVIVVGEDYIIEDSGRCVKNPTNNRMELMAILKALKKIIDLNLNSYNNTIYTDSRYSISVLKGNSSYTINNDLISEIKQLLKYVNVNFHWVKAHIGNPWNELVDTMSRNKAKSKIL